MPRISLLKDASTDRLYTRRYQRNSGKKWQRCNSTVSSGFGIVCGVPRQTQPGKVLKNEIIIVVTKAPAITTKHSTHSLIKNSNQKGTHPKAITF